jgi:hypothetical protein
MNKITEIVLLTRRTGSSTWILKSCISNPECIVVCADKERAQYMEMQYRDLLYKSPWYLKLKWYFFGRKNPRFVSVQYDPNNIFRRNDLPVIFDNSALLTVLN